MVKKKSYSEEKLNEMIVWSNNHANELLRKCRLNKFYTKFETTAAESCIMQAKQCLGNYKMAGAFKLIFGGYLVRNKSRCFFHQQNMKSMQCVCNKKLICIND